jgi:imidazolonepropionase-like amidohydrolase
VAKIESVRQAGRDSLRIYAEHGVQMGFGSDLLGEMHQDQSHEFIIRAEILGNLETIRSATSVAAAILQREGVLGTVRAGAQADLIVVDGNPLQDITLLTGQGEHLSLVMQAGHIHRSRA